MGRKVGIRGLMLQLERTYDGLYVRGGCTGGILPTYLAKVPTRWASTASVHDGVFSSPSIYMVGMRMDCFGNKPSRWPRPPAADLGKKPGSPSLA